MNKELNGFVKAVTDDFPALIAYVVVPDSVDDAPDVKVTRKVPRGPEPHTVTVSYIPMLGTPRWGVVFGNVDEAFWYQDEAIRFVVNSFLEYSN